jgi:cytosolic carboxypeptidase protein 6
MIRTLSKFPLFALFLIFLLSACKTTEEFTGYSYDPEGVTETFDREINHQNHRTIGFLSDGVWITNEFRGARANDVVRVARHHYKITIHPEISPINNSPWYGFRVWADDTTEVKLELEYTNGRQRYTPRFSRDDGRSWVKADSTMYRVVPETRNGIINLTLGPEKLWISAQEVFTTVQFREWAEKLSLKPFVQTSVIGNSHQGRPVTMIKMSEQSTEPVKGVVLIYGRQHPPEIPGYMVSLGFMETLAADTPLARKFRSYFDVWAFPMMNPDGADNGHWRTNAAGVDLNRDWQHFNQPETAAVRRAIMPLKKRADRKVFYGIDFHSTGRNIFYPILKEIDTFPLHFTYRWAERIQKEVPEIDLGVQAFDIVSPIAKNWTHKTFGVDAVTFEVWDNQPREELHNYAVRSAEIFMEMMIEEFEKAMKQEEMSSDRSR